jgi:hypothetical protein
MLQAVATPVWGRNWLERLMFFLTPGTQSTEMTSLYLKIPPLLTYFFNLHIHFAYLKKIDNSLHAYSSFENRQSAMILLGSKFWSLINVSS